MQSNRRHRTHWPFEHMGAEGVTQTLNSTAIVDSRADKKRERKEKKKKKERET